MQTQSPHFGRLLGAALVFGSALSAIGWTSAQAAVTARADKVAESPRIISVDANAYGNNYGQWSARWTQWWLSLPADKNPFTDTTGANCAEGQSGPVWFLAGAPGDAPPTRLCTVPTGKALFFPILNAVFGSSIFDCEPTVPGVTCNLATLYGAAAGAVDAVTMSVEIDGKSIRDLNGRRVASPAFTVTYPQDSSTGVASGSYSPNVTDGYWLMIAPLRPGAHTLHFKGAFTGGPFAGALIEVTYQLTVAP